MERLEDIKTKGELINFLVNFARKRIEEKTNKYFSYPLIDEYDAEEIINRICEEKFEKKWGKLKKREKKEVIKESIRRVIKYQMENLKDKTYQKKHEDLGDKKYETEKYIIYLQYFKDVSVHPSPEDFRPYLRKEMFDKKRNKKIYVIRIADEDIYESSQHFNRLTIVKFDTKFTKNSAYFFIKYYLYRKKLEFGRHKEFGFLFGIDDGSFFVDRVSPNVNDVEEAIEWLKPAEVRRAEEEGRLILRQGDVFFVELKSKKKTIFDYKNQLPNNHKIEKKENGNIIVKHYEHSYLILPHPHFKPIVRKTLNTRVGLTRFD